MRILQKDLSLIYVLSVCVYLNNIFLFYKDVGARCQKLIAVFTDGPTERAKSVFEAYNSDKKVSGFGVLSSYIYRTSISLGRISSSHILETTTGQMKFV